MQRQVCRAGAGAGVGNVDARRHIEHAAARDAGQLADLPDIALDRALPARPRGCAALGTGGIGRICSRLGTSSATAPELVLAGEGGAPMCLPGHRQVGSATASAGIAAAGSGGVSGRRVPAAGDERPRIGRAANLRRGADVDAGVSASSMPWETRVLAEASGSSSRWRLGQGPATMSSWSGLSAAAMACPGNSPTITAPRRLNARSVRARPWRALVSASASVE